jgi:putative glutamine amidotransferase
VSRPRILLTTTSSPRLQGLRRTDSLTGLNYSEAIALLGGLPLMVANLAPPYAEALAAEADGILFTGGADIDPNYFGAQPHPGLGRIDGLRDAFELALYRAAKDRNLPILGVCRGIQLINVAEGGTLHQHLPARPDLTQHDQQEIDGDPFHTVALEPDSYLARALGTGALRTNSYHHQAVDRLGQNLRITGRTSDGIIEAIEGTAGRFVLGVQWHPEMSFARYREHLAPFEVFMHAVKEGKLALDR